MKRLFALLALAYAVSPAWAAFNYSRSVTIDHTQCGASDSSNFPVLVSISDTSFKDTGHGGHVQSSTGADILFFGDSGLSSQLASQVESYDNVNGVLLAWVKLGTVSHASNTVFYVAYGNASPPAQTTNPWDANFIGRYHLADNAASTTVADSTTAANNGTNQANTTGKPHHRADRRCSCLQRIERLYDLAHRQHVRYISYDNDHLALGEDEAGQRRSPSP